MSKTTQQQMLSRQVLSDTLTKEYYGYGVSVGNRDNRDYIEHGGSWAGYTSNLVRYVADDVTVVVLSNDASDAYSVSHVLADILFDKPVVLPRKQIAIAVPENILNSY